METLNLFDLFARIILDTSDYDDNLDEASRNTESFADKLKNGLSTAAKVGAAALTAAATGVAALTKASLDQYAEYEQLVGGVDTLFKDASDTIQQYAANAYKTAGVSANTYMEQATAFSASLIQSLGGDTQAAAEYANQAIMDMSDNANKMGTDIESIQQTYQSLMRGNYAMLDNLKLGYGGTKSELERLVADAEELTGQALDPAKFSDVITAIHAVQENMGITGTTAKEAATTIEGSIGMMQAAWQNLLAGFGNEDADLGQLIGNFTSSVETAAQNVVPRITQILSGLGTAIQQLAPIISSEIPSLLSSMLPALISAGSQLLVGLVTGLVGALPELAASIPEIVTTIYNSIVAAGPELLTAGTQLLSMLANGIMTGIPMLASTAVTMMSSLGQYLRNNLPSLMQAGLEAVSNFTASLRENAGLVISGALGLAQSLAQGLADSIPTIVQNVPTIVSNIANIINDNAPKLIATAANMVATLAKGLIDAIPTIIQNIPKIISAIVDTLMAFNWVNLGSSVIKGLGNGIKAAGNFVKEAASSIVNTIKTNISQLPQQMLTIGKNIVRGLWQGIQNMASWIKDKIFGLIGGIVSGVKNLLGIHSPSTVFADMGRNMALGLGNGWDSEYDRIRGQIENGMNFGTANVDFASSGLGRSQSGLSGALNSMAATMGQNFTITVQSVLDGKVIGETAYQYSRNKQRAYGT